MIVFDGSVKCRHTAVFLSQDNDGPDEVNARGQSGYEADRLFQPPFKCWILFQCTLHKHVETKRINVKHSAFM